MKILIIGPAWVGDMVMAQGLFRLLKQQSPEVEIDVLAPEYTRPLLERMPELHETLTLPFKHGDFLFFKRWEIGKQLRIKKYDQAIVLPNSWKSAIIPFAANIPLRTGWLGELRFGLLNDVRYLDKKKYPLMLQRFIALGLPQHATLPDKLPKPKLITSSIQIPPARKRILAVCPGAEFGPSKRWPHEYFAEVANHYLSNHWDVWLFGSAKDHPIAEHINELTEHRCNNLCGKTSLGEAVDLLANVTLVVTNDSGLMHIAAALDKPLVAMYGSTDPSFTPPLSPLAKIAAIELPCRPCFQRECPLHHHKCMRELLPAKIIEVSEQCER
jgi:heptosyltransferase-2